MAATTRASGKIILQYLIKDVLGQPDDSPIKLSLTEDEYNNIAGFMGMSDEDIVALCYHNDKKDKVDLSRSNHSLLRWLQSFIYHAQSNGITDLKV